MQKKFILQSNKLKNEKFSHVSEIIFNILVYSSRRTISQVAHRLFRIRFSWNRLGQGRL